jgi:DNA-binding NarL/FixJ family response regulator
MLVLLLSTLQLHIVEARPMTGSEVKVLCVDDQNLVRECVVAIIEQAPGFRASEARTLKGALECFAEARPDVTLLSLHPHGMDGLEAIREIRRVDPGARIVVYAMDETDAVYFALDAGATGFVLKDTGAADLVRVITEVHTRNGVLLDDFRSKLKARGGLETLTTREIEVVELFTQGFRTKAIAATLRISDYTVKAHMKNIYKKLGVQGRAAALAQALRRGFVRLAAGRHVPSVHIGTRGAVADARTGTSRRVATVSPGRAASDWRAAV